MSILSNMGGVDLVRSGLFQFMPICSKFLGYLHSKMNKYLSKELIFDSLH